jgi:hypothetical protein
LVAVVRKAAASPPVRLRLVELMGPAGAGKSTVFQSLLARDQTILVRPALRHTGYAGIVAVNLTKATATLIRRRAFDREDFKDQIQVMMYLQALPRVLPRLGSPGNSAIVFDQGPLFLLTRHNFMDERLVTWWNRMVDTWAPLLDMVVCLDAPDALLRERINTREKWHALKGADGVSTLDVLRTSRRVYERTLEAVAARPCSPAILRFDTSTMSADEIAAAILAEIHCGTGRRPHTRVEPALPGSEE